jgi:AAA family ATP:ADP antiporter
MSNINLHPFKSKLRNIFWPIHAYELGKFLPISGLMFCILFNQNVLRILKDSILIAEVSAEVTSFSKVYIVTPMAAIFVIVYAKMMSHLTFDRIYYYLVLVFSGFYIFFAFVIYPNVDLFHIENEQLDQLMSASPHLKWYIAIIGNWSYVLFYSLSELWPNIFYVLLFWQFANEITTTNEAKRFYTLFSLFGNSSLIVVGLLMMYLTSEESFLKSYFLASESKIILTQVSVVLVTVSSIASCFFVRYIVKIVMTNPLLYYKAKDERKTEEQMGLIESFKYIIRSKYLWLMLICSASFGLSMNLVEAVWKSKIKELYPTVSEYAAYNGMYILWTGIIIMIMTIIGNNIMRSSSWFLTAVITPVMILVTGTAFFLLVVFDKAIVGLFDGIILLMPLTLAVFIGAVQNILSKGVKYSIWDSSIQMLYIPLDQELRTRGKAAVDVISPKIGKSSSGLVQSIIFTILPTATYGSISSVLMVVFIIICVLWIYAVRKIYLEYQKIV